MDFIQLNNNGYRIIINLKNLPYELIGELLQDIKESKINWYNFSSCEIESNKFWFADGYNYIECIRLNKVLKLIEFE